FTLIGCQTATSVSTLLTQHQPDLAADSAVFLLAEAKNMSSFLVEAFMETTKCHADPLGARRYHPIAVAASSTLPTANGALANHAATSPVQQVNGTKRAAEVRY